MFRKVWYNHILLTKLLAGHKICNTPAVNTSTLYVCIPDGKNFVAGTVYSQDYVSRVLSRKSQ